MRVVRVLIAILLLLAAAAGAGYLWFTVAVSGPGPLATPATVIIAPGSGVNAIAGQLAEAGVIRAPWLFALEVRRAGQGRTLKPGEYRFEPGVSLQAALQKIVRREVVARFVTIPEGLVTGQIVGIVAAAEGLQGDVPMPLRDGELMPETYRYEWGDTRAAVVNRMKQARDTALTDLWAKRRPDLPLATPEEALVLASIVEKETGVAAERPRVAAVFVNRLRLGMRLQSDPTVIYGLNPDGLDRELTRADLAEPTPFNTYVIDRLPPSPICHPGRASLSAVLNPPDTNELYFVADGTGGHAFAASLEEHNRNVARWRDLRRNSSDGR
jgi:UPF0755 protein